VRGSKNPRGLAQAQDTIERFVKSARGLAVLRPIMETVDLPHGPYFERAGLVVSRFSPKAIRLELFQPAQLPESQEWQIQADEFIAVEGEFLECLAHLESTGSAIAKLAGFEPKS